MTHDDRDLAKRLQLEELWCFVPTARQVNENELERDLFLCEDHGNDASSTGCVWSRGQFENHVIPLVECKMDKGE